MSSLASIRTNIFYAKKISESGSSLDEYVKYNELIFLIDKPNYTRTNKGEIIQERSVEELRFTVSETAFDEMLKILIGLKDVKEDDLIV